jgi:hypothetical protein
MDYPPVTILLLTFKRTDYAIRTVQAVAKHIRYQGDLLWYVADDGSDEEHWRTVNTLIDSISDKRIGYHTLPGGTYGENASKGWHVALDHCDITLFLEDDWELRQELNITPYVNLLMNTPRIGMVRMGYLNLGMRGTVFGHMGKLFWELDRTVDPYVCTGHPCLRHRRFREAYGAIPAGLNPGETELAYALQYRDAVFGPEIVWPAELGEGSNWFGHIGEAKSY